jgi:hypothetical protein
MPQQMTVFIAVGKFIQNAFSLPPQERLFNLRFEVFAAETMKNIRDDDNLHDRSIIPVLSQRGNSMNIVN